MAPVAAFSLDDVGTNEIDDAFSLQRSGGKLRVGIHIAAPGLAFSPGSVLDTIARERLSTAYMPGRVVAVLVEQGKHVEVGQGIVVLEAMKMENEIRAEVAGVVTKLHVKPGQSVEGGDLLFEIGDG